MRVLLTGASGYIGLHIVSELLSAGYHVTAVARSPDKLSAFSQASNFRVETADLMKVEDFSPLLSGHESVIHAALIWGKPGTELELWDTRAAAKLFDTAGRVGIERCVYISAAAVHRPFSSDMCEDKALLTADLYGATKAAGELFLRAACETYKMRGIAIRPGPVVGPPIFTGGPFRSDRRIREFVLNALASRPLEVNALEGRQFTEAIALARAVLLVLTAEEPHSTYICVDREVITWERVAREVIARVGSDSEVLLQNSCKADETPRFNTGRIEKLLGSSLDASEAIKAHVDYLVTLAV